MSGFIKNVFIIVFILAVSTLLWAIFFSEWGRQIIWAGLEPAFVTNWDLNTLDDGVKMGEALDAAFDEIDEIKEFRLN